MIKPNYEDLINIEYKKNSLLVLLFMVVLLLLIIGFSKKVYSSFMYEGVYLDGVISVTKSANSKNYFKEGEYVIINNKKYDYKILSYSDVFINGSEYYQNIYLSIDEVFLENEILELNIFYDKDKIINKVIDIIF